MYLIAGNVIQLLLNAENLKIITKLFVYLTALIYALSLIPIAGALCYIIYVIIK
jgi:hypothetical protein